jgi:Domain of unknown function (DUF4440)
MQDPTGLLEKLGEDWAAAELGGDTAFLERALADDFIAVGPRGFMLTKEQWLSRHASGSLTYASFEWDEMRAEARYDDGDVRHEIRDQFRATLVFVQEHERWLLLGLHLSPISAPPNGSQAQDSNGPGERA